MDATALLNFLRRMKLEHVYQPVIVRTAAEQGGRATWRDLARAYVLEDEALLRSVEERLKRTPREVLVRHGVIEVVPDGVRLTADIRDRGMKARIVAICEERLHDFLERRGAKLWSGVFGPVSTRDEWVVLEEAGLRCARCQRSDRALEVDHIVPRSQGGSNELSNLQCLCWVCNREKGNREAVDYRALDHPHRRPDGSSRVG